MNLKATKTPLLIAAMATAITLTTFLPANAGTFWASAEVENAQVIDANFKVKVKKHHGFKPYYASPKSKHFVKKKHVSSSDLKKKLILKKLF